MNETQEVQEAETEAKPVIQRDVYAVVTHCTQPRVLLLEGGHLPHFHPDTIYWSNGARLSGAIKEKIGLDVTLLRCLCRMTDLEVEKRSKMLVLVENGDPNWMPPRGARWVGLEELAALELAEPWQREYIETWLHEDETGQIPEQRAAWARRGWVSEVQAWITRTLSPMGITQTGPMEQVKHWGISSIWRIPTGDGDIYFKAVPPIFIAEPAITETLGRLYPEYIPAPLFIDAEKGWMLMRDFGGPIMWSTRPTAQQCIETLQILGRIQLGSLSHKDMLLATGCKDRRLSVLRSQIDSLLADDYALSHIEPEEAERFRALGPRLKEMCDQLAAYKVPDALVHGDFHPGNIAVVGESFLVYDWTDACISHPFLDLATLLDESQLAELGMTGAIPAMRDAYLQLWTEYEPIERLREAAELAMTLSVLHQIISYWGIAVSLEPAARWEMQSGLAEWPRTLLQIAH